MDFDGIVFAGGGCRCFWQAGFYQEAHESLGLRPEAAAGASAGAVIGCVTLAGAAERALKTFKQLASENQRNFYPRRAVFGGGPVFPHESIFRSAILETVCDKTLETIRSGTPMRVALTRARNSRLGIVPRALAGTLAYKLEGWATDRVHRQWPARSGLEVEWAFANECESVDELADLLLQTSCSPPFTPAYRRDGRHVLDGGIVDNVPVAGLPASRKILVLLTRRYESLPTTEGVVYVQPSEPIPIGSWDYTSPEKLQQSFDLGRKDGEEYARSYRQ
jgi:predicted acylesterase/phospholipase RssA